MMRLRMVHHRIRIMGVCHFYHNRLRMLLRVTQSLLRRRDLEILRVGMQLVTTVNATLKAYHLLINQSADPLRPRLSQIKHHHLLMVTLVVLSNQVSR